MKQIKIPAVFMRGGTSNAIVFHQKDLPQDRALWSDIFLAAIGSPDPNGRQLDGMGGGVSSLSKVCVVGPATRPDADIDYTFAQVMIKETQVDFTSNCGNMSSAMGPFAVDEGLVKAADTEAVVRIHNTNTSKVIHARFPVVQGVAAVDGDLEIPGVAGTGAPVRLEFLAPGGATTGTLLPTGNVRDTLEVPGLGRIDVSVVDVANACVFVRASDLGLTGIELPEQLEANQNVMNQLAAIRLAASVAMGYARDTAEAARKANPAVGFVTGPQNAKLLSGATIHADRMDLTGRMIAKGQVHRALPLTRTLCMAAAARIEGTIVHEAARAVSDPDTEIRIGMPSGILVAAAVVRNRNGQWEVERGTFLRTQRRLFEGSVLMRGSRVPGLANQSNRNLFAA